MTEYYGGDKHIKLEDIETQMNNGVDTFPYFRYCMTKRDIVRRLAGLKSYKFRIMKVPHYQITNLRGFKMLGFMGGTPSIAVCHYNDYTNYNKISDYYQDYARSRAKRYDNKYSTHEYWQNNWRSIYNSCSAKNISNVTAFNLREALYFAQQEVGSFRCTNLAGTIDMFGSKNVLDFSAGWGDRLAAALAKDVKYTGVDPNTLLFEGYNEFIADFRSWSDEKEKQKMICSPFESTTIDEELKSRGPYDLVFTSPPYFNLEVYSAEATQSADEESNIDEWYNKFLMVALNKSIELMSDDGYLVIVINDIRNGPPFTLRMVNDLCGNKQLKYMGVLSYSEFVGGGNGGKPKSPQPMWIWRKHL